MGIFNLFGPDVEEMKTRGDIDGLIAILQSNKDSNVRRKAAEALGMIGDEKALEPLLQVLKYGDENVRLGAVLALGRLRAVRALEPLMKALKDECSFVREEAARALGEIQDASAVPSLIEALKDWDVCVQKAAAKALGKIGYPTVTHLTHTLEDKNKRIRTSGRVLPELLGRSKMREQLIP